MQSYQLYKKLSADKTFCTSIYFLRQDLSYKSAQDAIIK